MRNKIFQWKDGKISFHVNYSRFFLFELPKGSLTPLCHQNALKESRGRGNAATAANNVRAILLKNIAVMQKQKPTMCAQFFIGFKNSPPAGILYQERSNESSLSETSSSQKFQSSQILCDPALLNINLKRCESCRQRRQQYLSCVFLKFFHCKSARGKSIYKLCRVWVWVWGGVVWVQEFFAVSWN